MGLNHIGLQISLMGNGRKAAGRQARPKQTDTDWRLR